MAGWDNGDLDLMEEINVDGYSLDDSNIHVSEHLIIEEDVTGTQNMSLMDRDTENSVPFVMKNMNTYSAHISKLRDLRDRDSEFKRKDATLDNGSNCIEYSEKFAQNSTDSCYYNEEDHKYTIYNSFNKKPVKRKANVDRERLLNSEYDLEPSKPVKCTKIRCSDNVDGRLLLRYAEHECEQTACLKFKNISEMNKEQLKRTCSKGKKSLASDVLEQFTDDRNTGLNKKLSVVVIDERCSSNLSQVTNKGCYTYVSDLDDLLESNALVKVTNVDDTMIFQSNVTQLTEDNENFLAFNESNRANDSSDVIHSEKNNNSNDQLTTDGAPEQTATSGLRNANIDDTPSPMIQSLDAVNDVLVKKNNGTSSVESRSNNEQIADTNNALVTENVALSAVSRSNDKLNTGVNDVLENSDISSTTVPHSNNEVTTDVDDVSVTKNESIASDFHNKLIIDRSDVLFRESDTSYSNNKSISNVNDTSGLENDDTKLSAINSNNKSATCSKNMKATRNNQLFQPTLDLDDKYMTDLISLTDTHEKNVPEQHAVIQITETSDDDASSFRSKSSRIVSDNDHSMRTLTNVVENDGLLKKSLETIVHDTNSQTNVVEHDSLLKEPLGAHETNTLKNVENDNLSNESLETVVHDTNTLTNVVQNDSLFKEPSETSVRDKNTLINVEHDSLLKEPLETTARNTNTLINVENDGLLKEPSATIVHDTNTLPIVVENDGLLKEPLESIVYETKQSKDLKNYDCERASSVNPEYSELMDLSEIKQSTSTISDNNEVSSENIVEDRNIDTFEMTNSSFNETVDNRDNHPDDQLNTNCEPSSHKLQENEDNEWVDADGGNRDKFITKNNDTDVEGKDDKTEIFRKLRVPKRPFIGFDDNEITDEEEDADMESSGDSLSVMHDECITTTTITSSTVTNSTVTITATTAIPVTLFEDKISVSSSSGFENVHRNGGNISNDLNRNFANVCQSSNSDQELVTDVRKCLTPIKVIKEENNDTVPNENETSVNTKNTSRGMGRDKFCWLCHRDNCNIGCVACPRNFHRKCYTPVINDCDIVNNGSSFICFECNASIQTSYDNETGSVLRQITLDQLCVVFNHVISIVKKSEQAELFYHPVDTAEFPHYTEYVVYPMDICRLEKNVKDKMYDCPEAFLADVKWILHNCIVFNSSSSKITTIARNLLKVCKREIAEIQTCAECYYNSLFKENWFVEVCKKPHMLIWARLKGFPFWPAKALKNKGDQVDVRFFGAHDRAWVPQKNCYLYYEQKLQSHQLRRGNIKTGLEEAEKYIKNLELKFGHFEYLSTKIVYDSSKEDEYLRLMLPNYDKYNNTEASIACPLKKIPDNKLGGDNNSIRSENSKKNSRKRDPSIKSDDDVPVKGDGGNRKSPRHIVTKPQSESGSNIRVENNSPALVTRNKRNVKTVQKNEKVVVKKPITIKRPTCDKGVGDCTIDDEIDDTMPLGFAAELNSQFDVGDKDHYGLIADNELTVQNDNVVKDGIHNNASFTPATFNDKPDDEFNKLETEGNSLSAPKSQNDESVSQVGSSNPNVENQEIRCSKTRSRKRTDENVTGGEVEDVNNNSDDEAKVKKNVTLETTAVCIPSETATISSSMQEKAVVDCNSVTMKNVSVEDLSKDSCHQRRSQPVVTISNIVKEIEATAKITYNKNNENQIENSDAGCFIHCTNGMRVAKHFLNKDGKVYPGKKLILLKSQLESSSNLEMSTEHDDRQISISTAPVVSANSSPNDKSEWFVSVSPAVDKSIKNCYDATSDEQSVDGSTSNTDKIEHIVSESPDIASRSNGNSLQSLRSVSLTENCDIDENDTEQIPSPLSTSNQTDCNGKNMWNITTGLSPSDIKILDQRLKDIEDERKRAQTNTSNITDDAVTTTTSGGILIRSDLFISPTSDNTIDNSSLLLNDNNDNDKSRDMLSAMSTDKLVIDESIVKVEMDSCDDNENEDQPLVIDEHREGSVISSQEELVSGGDAMIFKEEEEEVEVEQFPVNDTSDSLTVERNLEDTRNAPDNCTTEQRDFLHLPDKTVDTNFIEPRSSSANSFNNSVVSALQQLKRPQRSEEPHQLYQQCQERLTNVTNNTDDTNSDAELSKYRNVSITSSAGRQTQMQRRPSCSGFLKRPNVDEIAAVDSSSSMLKRPKMIDNRTVCVRNITLSVIETSPSVNNSSSISRIDNSELTIAPVVAIDPPVNNDATTTSLCKEMFDKLGNHFEKMVDEMLEKLAGNGDLRASVSLLKKDIETLRTHYENVIKRMKIDFEAEMSTVRSTAETKARYDLSLQRLTFEREKEQTIKAIKKVHWCTKCQKLAKFHCCWTASYCSESCQLEHWNVHESKCRASRQPRNQLGLSRILPQNSLTDNNSTPAINDLSQIYSSGSTGIFPNSQVSNISQTTSKGNLQSRQPATTKNLFVVKHRPILPRTTNSSTSSPSTGCYTNSAVSINYINGINNVSSINSSSSSSSSSSNNNNINATNYLLPTSSKRVRNNQ